MSIFKYNLTDLNAVLPGEIDLFICSASFEDRCLSISNHLDIARVRLPVVAYYKNVLGETEKNTSVLLGKYPSCHSMILDTDDPIASFKSINGILSRVLTDSILNVLIDITTFTRESLLIIIRLLHHRLPISAKLFVLYSGAEDYSIGDAVENKWLSKGIREVRSVLLYPGRTLPSDKLHLIVLAGFESERALRLIEEYEPSLLSLGYGTQASSTNFKHYATNKSFHEMLFLRSGEPKNNHWIRKFEMYPDDPDATKKAIEAVVRDSGGYSIVIAAMNTKLSTVGAALLAIEDENIQLCYAQPDFYNYKAYSTPQDTFYLYDLIRNIG